MAIKWTEVNKEKPTCDMEVLLKMENGDFAIGRFSEKEDNFTQRTGIPTHWAKLNAPWESGSMFWNDKATKGLPDAFPVLTCFGDPQIFDGACAYHVYTESEKDEVRINATHWLEINDPAENKGEISEEG